MEWQAIVDFDGTITRRDTTDQILERFASAEWQEVEEDWLAGRIGSSECMRRQVELLRVSPDDLDAFIDGIEIDWSFLSFVRLCARYGVPVTIVSDGLDLTIKQVLKRVGLGHLPIVANHLEHAGGDRWVLSSPHAAASGDCTSGTCKCAVASSLHRPLTLLVGDGKSDHCVAGQADRVFAKAGLVTYCRANDLPHQAFTDFSEAVSLLEDLLCTDAPAATRLKTKDMING